MWILQEEGVTVENGAANHYTATVIGWPNCVAEGATREEAMTLYVLDTDHISLYQKSHPPVVARLKLVAPRIWLAPLSALKSNCVVGLMRFTRRIPAKDCNRRTWGCVRGSNISIPFMYWISLRKRAVAT